MSKSIPLPFPLIILQFILYSLPPAPTEIIYEIEYFPFYIFWGNVSSISLMCVFKNPIISLKWNSDFLFLKITVSSVIWSQNSESYLGHPINLSWLFHSQAEVHGPASCSSTHKTALMLPFFKHALPTLHTIFNCYPVSLLSLHQNYSK